MLLFLMVHFCTFLELINLTNIFLHTHTFFTMIKRRLLSNLHPFCVFFFIICTLIDFLGGRLHCWTREEDFIDFGYLIY